MAIVNTFAKCLESPYLFRDPEAPQRVGGLLEFASDRLEAAASLRDDPQSDPADIALLCYEAMFACIRALVYSEGYREAGMSCLLLACEELHVRSGRLDGQHLTRFAKAQGLKLPPADAVPAASELVKRTLEILGA